MRENPFFYGSVVSGNHFCNRTKELQELIYNMQSGLNLFLYAPRRFGKTSLVLKAIKQSNMEYIFLDFMSLIDERGFINEYFNAISKNIDTPTEKIVKFFKNTLNIRPNITVNFTDSGEPNFKLDFFTKEQKTTLKEVLELPYLYAKHKNKKVIVAFDEFQEVTRLGIENTLRSVVQHHENHVSYVFFGSKKSMMKELFLDTKRAFYKSVKHVNIKEISKSEWTKYIQNGFEKYNKTISNECINIILQASKCFPYYTQQISYELFSKTEKVATQNIVLDTINFILQGEEDLFLSDFSHLSTNQKKALFLLIYANGEKIYTQETMQEFNFTSSSLKKAIEGLLSKDVIDLKEKKYYFQDPLFEMYLKRL